MIGQTAILLVALLAAVVVCAVLALLLASRLRRLRDDVRHERGVSRRRILALTGGEGPTWSGAVAVSEVLHTATRFLGEDGQDVARRTDTNRTLPAPVAHDVCVILTELVDNALCFSDVSEEVTVYARAANDGSLLIEVEDSGDGMSRDTLRLANRTLKGSPPDDQEGLGLVLAGRLAARHGLRVVLAARGDGTMASIVVPPNVAAAAAPQRPARPAAPPTPPPTAPSRTAAPPRQPVSSVDSGESTAVWTPPWSGEGQSRPSGGGRERAPSRPSAPSPPHAVPARPAASGAGSRHPHAPAAAGSGATRSGSLPLPPAPAGLDQSPPGWLTASPDADPARVPDLGNHTPGGSFPGSYPDGGYGGYGSSPYEDRHASRPGDQSGRDYSPIFDSVASNWFDAPSSYDTGSSWQSPADPGWSAVEDAYGEPTPPAGSLPRREPMSHLVPGSVQPTRPSRPTWDEPPSPDTWATYQSQVDHGRRAWFRQVGEDADDLGDPRR